MIRGVIFDFNRTLYDPDSRQLAEGALQLLGRLRSRGYAMCLISKKSAEDRRRQQSADTSRRRGADFKRIGCRGS